jgi:acylphosphatase
MALHLHITGVVQGVGYRAAFERQARRLGLSGWVRNRHDGTVEAVVDGGAAALVDIEAWAARRRLSISRHGPARVRPAPAYGR